MVKKDIRDSCKGIWPLLVDIISEHIYSGSSLLFPTEASVTTCTGKLSEYIFFRVHKTTFRDPLISKLKVTQVTSQHCTRVGIQARLQRAGIITPYIGLPGREEWTYFPFLKKTPTTGLQLLLLIEWSEGRLLEYD